MKYEEYFNGKFVHKDHPEIGFVITQMSESSDSRGIPEVTFELRGIGSAGHGLDLTVSEHVFFSEYIQVENDIMAPNPFKLPQHMVTDPVCECGIEKIGGGIHSDWCAKYKKAIS